MTGRRSLKHRGFTYFVAVYTDLVYFFKKFAYFYYFFIKFLYLS